MESMTRMMPIPRMSAVRARSLNASADGMDERG
jgi:hypothetical protein